MSRTYYTVCVYENPGDGWTWFDVFGSYSRKEAKEEAECWVDGLIDRPKACVKIVPNDGTAKDMIAKRDSLPHPVWRRKK